MSFLFTGRKFLEATRSPLPALITAAGRFPAVIVTDSTAPTQPGTPVGTAFSTSQIDWTWTVSSDSGGSGLQGYRVYLDGSVTPTTTVTTNSYSSTGHGASTSHTLRVEAYDGAGNSTSSGTGSQTTQSGSSAGVVPESGFNVTTTTSFAHGNVMRITRSAGSWGTHADFNPGNYTWMGKRYICFLMKSFEDGLYETNGLDWQTGGAQWDVVTSSVVSPRTGLTRSARQRGVTSRQGELVISPSINPQHLLWSVDVRLGSPYDGKFMRIWGNSDSLYFSTGGSSGTSFRGGNNAADDVFGSPNGFSTSTWNRAEIYHKLTSPTTLRTHLNCAVQWTKSWNAGGLGGHTLDLGNLLEVGNTVYFADEFIDFHNVAFYLTDSATFPTVFGSKRMTQVPTAWAAADVSLAINLGEFTDLVGKYLWSYDHATQTATRIAQFVSP
jgi:hypothetical protein